MTLILQTAALLKNSVHAPRRLRGSLLYEVRVQVGSQLGLIRRGDAAGLPIARSRRTRRRRRSTGPQ